MIKVKLTTNFPKEPLLRQTPGRQGLWGHCEFKINQKVRECDWWVVFEGLLSKDATRCPRGNTIFISGEPPSLRTYNPSFLHKFDTVMTCHRNLEHAGVTYSQQGLPWHIGRRVMRDVDQYPFSLDYDALKSMRALKKDRLISVIASGKDMSDGHRKRIAFVRKLTHYFGSRIDVFHPGVDYDDKWDAIASYKYHLVLENSSYPDYWTEKLSDAYLAGAYPFYYGCPNISDYFPEAALTCIDISQPEQAIWKIEEMIQADKYENSINEVMKSRDLVLDKYNLFAFIAEFCEGLESSSRRARIVLLPEGTVPSWRRVVRYGRRTLANLMQNALRIGITQ